MPEWTLHEWLVVALPVAALAVALLVWRLPKPSKNEITREPRRFELYPSKEFPEIHATNGVPALQQLTDDLELDARRLGVAERLYAAGLAQFNHYVNSRERVIEESRAQMTNLANFLNQSEIALAESVGISLATDNHPGRKAEVQAQYSEMSPQAQIYAQHKRSEIDALRRIARDLEKNVPRTDYTSVKARIASGNVKLSSVMSELPISWQDIRTLNDKFERPKITGKPPKREFLHVTFIMRQKGLLEDKRAEKDGDWIISDKHDMMVPYQDPVPRFELKEWGEHPVQKGEIVIINQDPTSEWDTEFWRQGGRLDQVYLRAKSGMAPDQLWSAYRRRLIRKAAWIFAGVMAMVNLAIVVAKYL